MPDNNQLVLVECVQQFRIRYLVSVPQGKFTLGDRVLDKAEWALDTVTMKEATEFSQLDLGETIVSHRVVTDAEALALCRADNDYAAGWTDEHLRKTFFTVDEQDPVDSSQAT